MKQIPLNSGTLSLPSCWEDLTFIQKIYVFGKLKEVFEERMSPVVFRLQILQYLTGYKPKTGILSFVLLYTWYLFRILFVAPYYYLRLGKVRFPLYFSVWRNHNRPKHYDREIINYNLFKLSELLDFAFTLTDRSVEWNRVFSDNPFPYLKIKGQKFNGRRFKRGIAPFTNITAREFSDCFDLFRAWQTADEASREAIGDKIISILYPATNNYLENMVSDHIDLIHITHSQIKFGILYWFSGIVDFYISHPYYSLLFRSPGNSEETGEKISLGMNELILMIQKNGYNPNDTVNDFFDAQLKIMKDNLSSAIAAGVSMDALSSKTGLRISEIDKLI